MLTKFIYSFIMLPERGDKMSRGTYMAVKYLHIPILFIYVPDFLVRRWLAKQISGKQSDSLKIKKNSENLLVLRELPRGYLASIHARHWDFRLGRL